MELLVLNGEERERYARTLNLMLLRESLKTRNLSCIILGLELRSSTAPHNADSVEALYDMFSDIILIKDGDLAKAWSAYEKHVAKYPDRKVSVNWNAFLSDDPAAAPDVKDAPNLVFKHEDPQVRRFLSHAFATNLNSVADKRSSGALKRICYLRNHEGREYAVTNVFKTIDRRDVLACLLDADDVTRNKGKKDFPLPMSLEAPSEFPKERGIATYACLISKTQPRLTVICDSCGAYSGNTPEGDYVAPKNDIVNLMFSADGRRLVSCSNSSRAQRILRVYRAKHHAMPRVHKTVYTLTDMKGKVAAPHLLVWSFETAVPESYQWPKPKPHGNSITNEDPYVRADPTIMDAAKELLRDPTMTIRAAQQLIYKQHGVTLKKNTMEYIAVDIRGKVGTLQSKDAKTNPATVNKLEELPGFRLRVFTKKHEADEASVNLVLVDTRLLKVAASCQPTPTDLKKRNKEVDEFLSSPEKYKDFMDNRGKRPHDASGYWREGDGGGWALDTTFGLSDYYITVLTAELPHIVTSKSGKRAWIPVGVIAHKRKDADTLAEGFLHLTQLMKPEISGTNKCAAFLLTDQEEALYQLLETKPFRHAMHGLCDFHLLCNFADSGFKSFKKGRPRKGGRGRRGRKENNDETENGEEEEEDAAQETDGMDSTDPLRETTDESDAEPDAGGRAPTKKRRLDKHCRTTAVLFGRVEGGMIKDVNEPVTHFQPGNVWAYTLAIFKTAMQTARDNDLLDKEDFDKIMADAETIYSKHGPRFRLFIGRSTMFNTTNPIEAFFKRLKLAIGKRRRTLDELYDNLHKLFSEIFQDVVLAVTEGRGSLLKTKKRHPYTVHTMDSDTATLHLIKYGLPNTFVDRENFGNPLPQKFIDVVTEKRKLGRFITNVEEHWKVLHTEEDVLLVKNTENPAEASQVTMLDYVLYCPLDRCMERCCAHIVTALALFPPDLERDKFISGCLEHYFCETAMYKNAERPGAGMKGATRKFTQKSKQNKRRPVAGRIRQSLCGTPEKSKTRSILSSTSGSMDGTFRRPTSRASSVSSNTSELSIHEGFSGPKPPVRRSPRTRTIRREFSSGAKK